MRSKVRLTLIAVAVVRLWTVGPSFIHSSLHASRLLDGVFGFPHLASHRATYGQFGFLALGAVSAVFGRRVETVSRLRNVPISSASGKRRLSGTSSSRTASVDACNDTARFTGTLSRSLPIFGTTPAVETVTLRGPSAKAVAPGGKSRKGESSVAARNGALAGEGVLHRVEVRPGAGRRRDDPHCGVGHGCPAGVDDFSGEDLRIKRNHETQSFDARHARRNVHVVKPSPRSRREINPGAG